MHRFSDNLSVYRFRVSVTQAIRDFATFSLDLETSDIERSMVSNQLEFSL